MPPSNQALKKPKERPVSFRLSKDNSNSGGISTNEPRNTSFSQEQFLKAWNDYAAFHPDQRILVAAMRAASPVKISETAYQVSVSHPAQKQAFEGCINELLDFIKNELSNDFVTLSIDISDSHSEEKEMNPREFLKLTIAENPELAKFLKAIDAELE